jgi:sigma-B regulation protein RsbU (phosphoserine phosphatase)
MNCGHIQPLLVDDSGLQWLPESNLIVGLLPGASYTSAQITLQPGARILLVTDGLVEAENCAGEAIGDEGFTDIVPHLDVDGILDHVARFQAPNQAQDDCTLVEVRYTGGRLIPQG